MKLSWFSGPLIAVGVVVVAGTMGLSPGQATLGMITAFAFVFVTPLIQFLLLRTHKFRGKHLEACTLALLLISIAALGAGASGVFNYW